VSTDAAAHLAALPEHELLAFVTRQRWFGSKSREVAGTRVVDVAELRGEAPTLLDVLLEIRYGSGTHDLYQLVVGLRDEGEPTEADIAWIEGRTAYEAVTDPTFAREVIDHVRSGTMLPAGEATIEFCGMAGLLEDAAPPEHVTALGLEQTNSSIVLDDRRIVKVYRRIEAGVNPELELLHFFATHGFENVPALHGWWSYAGPLMNASLGMVQEFVPGAVDGWTLALDELRSDPALFLDRVRRLGEVIGQMHAVLASEPDDPAFSPEDGSQESLALLSATVDEEIDRVFLTLPDNDATAPLAGRGDSVRDLLRDLSTVGSVGRRIRHHGDLHLGQVLWARDDWLVIDFEGEPARPLPERRLKHSPLRDVAGMLRSFTYAVRVAGVDDDSVESKARADFLDGYMQAVQQASILPSRETSERLLQIFELEKAVYELRYELAHRPDWVSIPVRGIVQLLEDAAA
jgi:trehalose synthase-fused probable maltokinase